MQNTSWDPDTVAWQEIAKDGSKYALLEGVRGQDGDPFTYAFSIPAGFWDPPHRHTQTARVFVAKGTLYLGYGNIEDESLLQAFPAGSLVIVPAHAVHFDGSHEDAVIFGCAVGPWRTIYVHPTYQGSAGTPGQPLA
ncbi:hypothetical protein SAMN05216548_108196 [Faunimonas pinastri]|uniref:ChrR-like cupin domain-containing protein n=2 Tax=Faunimonas pinastri TaxID=1855383 RepID=A0A1H9JNQ8_9HYPH|nr:hypothetical protein SAMN05216548_108196 [Faunimonas pinastri]